MISEGGAKESAGEAGAAAVEGARAGRPFFIDIEVRDSELDAQGIVNNANYLHYYEHARHSFLRSRGVDFVAMHEEGLDAIVFRIEVDYRESLRSGDGCAVSVVVEREGRLRLVFRQDIVKKSNGHVASSARVVTAIVSGGRPVIPSDDMVARLLR
ncbi:MAG TPA: thioesterase family protein [Rectinemataceae bacterium]|nr:thioesterase family protein [Rectinemataceae bacterium]